MLSRAFSLLHIKPPLQPTPSSGAQIHSMQTHDPATQHRIKIGDRLPYDVTFGVLNEGEEDPHLMSAKEVFEAKKVVLFGIPGAYTSICSAKHLPQYIEHYDDFKNKYAIDTVACTAVNDPYVLREWAKAHNAAGKILMLSDGCLEFHSRVELTQTLPFAGVRGLRFSLFADDGVVKILNVDEPGPK
ncbi:peroxiredoxin V protein, partial [Jimgerdemannia flammicorona]